MKETIWIDSETMNKGGVKFGGADREFGGVAAKTIARTNDLATFDADAE